MDYRELVTKLLRLASDPGATEHEKRNAQDKAERIAAKYHVKIVTRPGPEPDAYTSYGRYDFVCDNCGGPLRAEKSARVHVPRQTDPHNAGRERRYCSNRCRQSAYRNRSRAHRSG